MSFSFIFASEDPTETEHWEKVRQLDQLAERFKAETGFTGNVNYYSDRMKLHSYEGKFADIPYSANADADTTSFRQACTRVLDKILPYSYANHNQLSMSRISKRSGYISTDYYQQVNGYRVEGSGFFMITYDIGRHRFDIGDNTVELPDEPLGKLISESEAYQIAFDKYKQTDLYNAAYPVRSRTVIYYKSRKIDGKSQPYRLYWRVTFPSISYFIDAITEDTFTEGYVINQ
jgi:hypothetical protein